MTKLAREAEEVEAAADDVTEPADAAVEVPVAAEELDWGRTTNIATIWY